MKKFYKNQYKIVTMLVLALVLQIVGPVAGGSVYANKATGEAFQVSNTSVDEEGQADVNWNLTLKSNAGVMKYKHEVDFTLEAEASGALIANDETVVGSYIVSKEGTMTATIDSATDILSRGDFTTEAAIDGSDIFTANIAGSFKAEGAKSKSERMLLGDGDLGNIFTDAEIKMDGVDIPLDSAIEITEDTMLEIKYKWGVSHPIAEGNYSIITLPEGIKLFRDETGDLINEIGGVDVVIGQYVLNKVNNTLQVIFNDKLEGANASSGEVWVNFEFDLEEFEKNTTQIIDFEKPIDKQFEITIKPQAGGDTIKKTGKANAGLNASQITWTIDVNTALDSINNAAVQDTLLPDLELVDNIEIYNLIVGYTGDPVQGDKVGEETKFPIQLGNIKSAYRIIYTTKITEPRQDSYTNVATITGDGEDGPLSEPDNATVSTPSGEPIEKFVDIPQGALNPKSITWRIQANTVSSEIDGAKVSDKLQDNLVLQDDSLKVYDLIIGESGSLTRGDIATGKTFAYDAVTGELVIDLGDIDSPYEIEYVTDIIYGEDLENDYNKTITFDNTAILTDGNNNILGSDTKTATVTRGEPSAKTGTKNIETGLKKIDWVIKVNETEDTIYDVWVEDKSGEGIGFMRDTLVVKDKDGKRLTENIHYTLEAPSIDGNDFKIVLKPVEITSSYTVEYSTRIKDENLDDGEFTNKARVSWMPKSVGPGDGTNGRIFKNLERNIDAPVNNTYDKSSTGINYLAKTMDWKISLGFYKGKTKNLVIRDTFPNNGLVFLEETLVITDGGKELSPQDYKVEKNRGELWKGFYNNI